MVYIREAHPSDGRVSRANVRQGINIPQPRTQKERNQVASDACSALRIQFPTAVDGIDDRVGRAYQGWPDRLYVVGRDGRVIYAGGRGPRGFSARELEQTLSQL